MYGQFLLYFSWIKCFAHRPLLCADVIIHFNNTYIKTVYNELFYYQFTYMYLSSMIFYNFTHMAMTRIMMFSLTTDLKHALTLDDYNEAANFLSPTDVVPNITL